MVYNAVSQADHEVVSNASDSDDQHSRSSSLHSQHHDAAFQQLPLDVDHIGAGSYLQPAKSAESSSIGGLGSMIRSITSTSYDMVEDDDYELPADPSSSSSAAQSPRNPRRVPPLDTTATTVDSSPSEAPLRSPISGEPIPLNHPTPGLQSLQGAYINNVERLERSAERMSMSSTNIGDEIRKLDLEQKRRSSGSSVYTNNQDGLKPSLSSRHGSIQSASRLAQVSEHSDVPYPASTNPTPVMPYLPPPPSAPARGELRLVDHEHYNHLLAEELERPCTAASTDTYQQARVLFTDFDGVHYVPSEKDLVRRVSLNRPPLASRSETYKEPQAGEDMVYYPAPVPMMLNLPPRLSRKPGAEREKRRTQLLGSIPTENRKSAPWMSQQDTDGNAPLRRDKEVAALPPQLRASVFFEQPSIPLNLELTQASAVATLDSILDASTHAPVSAFTDHPIAGASGHAKLTRKPSAGGLLDLSKKRASRSTLGFDRRLSDPELEQRPVTSDRFYKQTEAEAADIHEGTLLREDEYGAPGGADMVHGEEDLPNPIEPEVEFTGPPNTLMAELEMRKNELKQRQKAVAGPFGLQSTLLQMDAVAQKQSEHRRQRPVTLAWESTDAHKVDEGDDDDVPLGMLFPEKAPATDEARPLGLMEKRAMEESEPLSRRRARLRGEPQPHTLERRTNTMYAATVPDVVAAAEDSGDEEETLAQRLQRLKSKDQAPSTVADSEFASEILAEINNVGADGEKGKADEIPPEDETLAQRRARLQREAEAEALKNSTLKIPRYRRSMADILHARRPSAVPRPPAKDAAVPQGAAQQYSHDPRLSLRQMPTYPGPQAGYAAARAAPYVSGVVHPNTFYSDAILGANHLTYAPGKHATKTTMRPIIHPGQREIIDRWRQSIV
ncbi:uncharacterized protein BP01DRAFT_356184 [Aspergillus saccharolyticus JOP 1030-1]|uniref:Uncharacterized protein n=1 Tax=Aspergillus saccharolyticus JOP 1030-1 TaxID=1450539 RepID=A0A318ZF12_9EURO|nr:hypothetical protein BP01DRAFT_356184 [Aspergillus saccharolyticus JOP 1030-1]PYH46009.1 hypothetical protein BP01DRAFT_356184 [Aspergillus saccharolyticus JOP 1030-1]